MGIPICEAALTCGKTDFDPCVERKRLLHDMARDIGVNWQEQNRVSSTHSMQVPVYRNGGARGSCASSGLLSGGTSLFEGGVRPKDGSGGQTPVWFGVVHDLFDLNNVKARVNGNHLFRRHGHDLELKFQMVLNWPRMEMHLWLDCGGTGVAGCSELSW